jgi:cell division protein FtsB
MDVETLQNRVYTNTPRPRKRRKRPIWRRNLLAFVVYALGLVAALAIVSSVVYRVARPVQLLSSEYRETRRLSRELKCLRQQNAVLERRIKHLQSPQGTEQAARKLGYVKPGEITLVIPE